MHTSTTPAPASTRTRSRLVAGIAAGIGAAALVLVAPVAANAHVHVTPTTTEAGAASELAFSFSHGCDGSPTTAVEVTIPEEVASVALIANAGWNVESALRDGARTVVFTADEPTPDGVRETLEVEVTLPEDAADGDVLTFPTLQVCETGETLWGDADPEAETPAPQLTIGETADAHGHAGHGQVETEGGHEGHAEEGAAADDAAAAAPAADAGTGPAVPLSIAAVVLAALAAVLAAVSLRRQSQRR
ncbi:YcnI family copper-binding membrane protein [Agrococcus baldri]|uniref:YncI copper-binding domain-containing protein n=1 Tax=Agrococcus baldri TaxID=153730 RepID=A0AA87RIU3_9MICO|nr:DUF1775 domain-containing protein [Agrococcus baldri]GEK81056.1 hypothetical protein ABA31_24070 [Agrococcus baldri]